MSILARAPRAPCPSHSTALIPALSPPAGPLRGTRRRVQGPRAATVSRIPQIVAAPPSSRPVVRIRRPAAAHTVTVRPRCLSVRVCVVCVGPVGSRLFYLTLYGRFRNTEYRTGCLEPPRMILWNSLLACQCHLLQDVASLSACDRARRLCPPLQAPSSRLLSRRDTDSCPLPFLREPALIQHMACSDCARPALRTAGAPRDVRSVLESPRAFVSKFPAHVVSARTVRDLRAAPLGGIDGCTCGSSAAGVSVRTRVATVFPVMSGAKTASSPWKCQIP